VDPFSVEVPDAVLEDLRERTRPQTLGYGLNDSPAGLAAWVLDRVAVVVGQRR
jgi:hypothetical protein